MRAGIWGYFIPSMFDRKNRYLRDQTNETELIVPGLISGL
jgi:hypothetical protein